MEQLEQGMPHEPQHQVALQQVTSTDAPAKRHAKMQTTSEVSYAPIVSGIVDDEALRVDGPQADVCSRVGCWTSVVQGRQAWGVPRVTTQQGQRLQLGCCLLQDLVASKQWSVQVQMQGKLLGGAHQMSCQYDGIVGVKLHR